MSVRPLATTIFPRLIAIGNDTDTNVTLAIIAAQAVISLSLIEEVREVWRVRRPLYEQAAHLQISTNSANVDACIAAILDKMPSTP